MPHLFEWKFSLIVHRGLLIIHFGLKKLEEEHVIKWTHS